jgi:hypothetical protein
MNDMRKYPPTLCWDCSKATGYCMWSTELEPVKGWKIIPTKRVNSDGEFYSLIVLECPEFERDAYKGGVIRKGDGTIYDTMSENS